MGGNGTKLVSLLKERKVSEAMLLWKDCPELEGKLKPNTPIGWTCRETPMHLVTRAGATDLLRYLLLERGGDPFVTNFNDETPIHIACASVTNDQQTEEQRSELLKLLLSAAIQDGASREGDGRDSYQVIPDEYGDEETRGDRFASHVEDRWNLGVVDKARNTPLHLAAASGLERCVSILLDHGAPLFAHNIAGQTPCEAAAQAKHEDIAKLLECKMVLMEDRFNGMTRYSVAIKKRKAYYNKADLEILRKELVSRLAQKLEIAEFPAEAFLQAYGWSEDLVMEAWRTDAPLACTQAGLSIDELRGERRMTTSRCVYECEVCTAGICLTKKISVSCGHHICCECWTKYLELQINEGGGKEIKCPSSACYMVVPNEVLLTLIPEDLFKKYKDFNLKDFMGSQRDMKWCPVPECKYMLKLSEEIWRESIQHRPQTAIGINVVCGNGHWVCWTCLQEAHEPCSCEQWIKWKEAFSFYSCNRYTERANARHHLRAMQIAHEDNERKLTEDNSRFLHHYDRYQNHIQSMKVEQKLLEASTAKCKAMTRTFERLVTARKELPRCNSIHTDDLVSSAASSACKNVNFIEDVILVLLHSRMILSTSYALGFFMLGGDGRRKLFEKLQGNLEEVVERLSQMVNRPYLCTTQSVMSATARSVSILCEKYLQSMRRGSDKEVHPTVLHSARPLKRTEFENC